MPTLKIKQYLPFAFSINDLAEQLDDLVRVSGSSTSAILRLPGESDAGHRALQRRQRQ
jgi:hypothetical protein